MFIRILFFSLLIFGGKTKFSQTLIDQTCTSNVGCWCYEKPNTLNMEICYCGDICRQKITGTEVSYYCEGPEKTLPPGCDTNSFTSVAQLKLNKRLNAKRKEEERKEAERKLI